LLFPLAGIIPNTLAFKELSNDQTSLYCRTKAQAFRSHENDVAKAKERGSCETSNLKPANATQQARVGSGYRRNPQIPNALNI
jgi:hypothetical protein